MKNILKNIHLALLYIPMLSLFAFVSFVLRASIKLGRKPTSSAPDPKDLKFDNHMFIVDSAFDIMMYSILITLILSAGILLTKYYKMNRIHFVSFISSVALFAIIIFIDPGGFFEWYLD